MKLHLGCGQRYLKGYVNIDYPPSEHTVMETLVADRYENILELYFEPGSIEEVRLHHVFEHFSRPQVCALLSIWHSWLKEGGILHIEVPDFERTAKAALSRFKSPKLRFVALRHLFGSHEAHWAVHYEGYSFRILTQLLKNFGFAIKEKKRNAWRGTYNIEVIAAKQGKTLSPVELEERAKKWMTNFMVDDSSSEKLLLEAWMNKYREVIGSSKPK